MTASDRRHLRLVDRRPPAPRLEVRISVSTAADGRPFGRSKPFFLDEHTLDELIQCAKRLEVRR